MNPITAILAADPYFKQLLMSLKDGKEKIYLHGLTDESTGHFLLSLMEMRKGPVFVVSSEEKRAMELAEGLDSISEGRSLYFPKEEFNFFRADSVISGYKSRRLAIMSRLCRGEDLLIFTTMQALDRPISSPREFKRKSLEISVGDILDIGDLTHDLISMMYERVLTVEARGQFAVRGGIVDVFPPSTDRAYRIEFFDNEIDSIRTFSVENQRSDQKLDKADICPASELILTADDLAEAGRNMKLELEKSIKNAKEGVDYDHSKEVYEKIIDDIEAGELTNASDLVLPYLPNENFYNIYDYLPDNAIVVFEDLDRIIEKEEGILRLKAEDRLELFKRGDLLKSHMEFGKSSSQILTELSPYKQINLSPILKRSRNFTPDQIIRDRSMPIENYKAKMDDFVASLIRRSKMGYRTIVFGGKRPQALFDTIKKYSLDMRLVLLNDGDNRLKDDRLEVKKGQIIWVNRSIPKGFIYLDSKICLISLSDITGRTKRKSKGKLRKKQNFLNYQDLEIGDFVVHENYGVGRYTGTEKLTMDGISQDFLKIEYKGSDVLYVPTSDMSLVSKYMSREGKSPSLSGLGSGEWKKSKARVKKALDAIAEDIVKLYAERSKIKGYAFSKDSPWQRDFEDSFAYEETPSQLRATEEIKEDMESDKPMDRLLCGDVGYGKTEVALRAAFKAIMDGKQVAFLCPTTILTQQHYQTMTERFKDFPLRIEYLSRFKSKADQNRVIRDIEQGGVDMVVGTHRLLSKDIKFKDLGLLVIDEEQRFGVKDKEKVKKKWKNVDVLTLSATPIPRTLQLSLTGIRDMSLLEEAPEERYPVTSYVMEYDGQVIKDALERELDREGQAYVIHNRVYDINRVAGHLQAMLPEARIAIANGQMKVGELEKVMEDFVKGNYDILLSTAIIETGMDIGRVNTMVILNSDRMGLAQLYQLKGRIGRSDRRAYAYFTYERSKIVSEVAEKRLKAIKDFSEFGSGYKIAMRDLELRGAGNILGESQSGHIDSIGYDLYVKMLEEAVRKAKGLPEIVDDENISVDIKVSAYIPESYIPNSSEKLYYYRHIALIEKIEDYSTIIEELIDRYGDPPESLINLLDLVMIKKMAARAGFSQVKEVSGYVELRYEDFGSFSVEELKEISETYKGPLSFDFQKQPKFKILSNSQKIKNVSNLLELILSISRKKENKKIGGSNEK